MPKKAKKGGGGKGGGKTEEERQLYQEQKAQAEEEMAKKKEEILTLFLKDKLQKEERNTAVNLMKLNEGWRSILRQTRAAELRHDITVLSQVFERHLDSLDSTIKNLEQDLQDAERQAARARRVHLQHLERLWAQQDRRLVFVQQQWENSLQHLNSRFNSERKQASENSEQQRVDLKNAAFAMEQHHKAVLHDINTLYNDCILSYNTAINDVTSLFHEDEMKLMEKTEQKEQLAQMWSEERKSLEKALTSNQLFIQLTNQDMKNVKKLQEAVIWLRTHTKRSTAENQMEVEDLAAARRQLSEKNLKLQEQLTRAQTAARKQLTDLTVQSDNAAKTLRAVITKGEKVLRVSELCHKLENEQKNVSPTLFSSEEHRPEEPAEDGSGDPLRQVMRRISAAVLQREALRTHRDDLKRENQQLRLLLQQHLDAMTVRNADATLDRRHALLTVRQAPTASAPPDTSRRHTVIEAVHVVKHTL